MRVLSIALLLAIVAAPSLAAKLPEVPKPTDHMLWCGSALYWLSVDASDNGSDAEADQLADESDKLMEVGATQLKTAGFSEEQIADTIDGYDDAVVAELNTPKARYDAATCPDLVPKD